MVLPMPPKCRHVVAVVSAFAIACVSGCVDSTEMRVRRHLAELAPSSSGADVFAMLRHDGFSVERQALRISARKDIGLTDWVEVVADVDENDRVLVTRVQRLSSLP